MRRYWKIQRADSAGARSTGTLLPQWSSRNPGRCRGVLQQPLQSESDPAAEERFDCLFERAVAEQASIDRVSRAGIADIGLVRNQQQRSDALEVVQLINVFEPAP